MAPTESQSALGGTQITTATLHSNRSQNQRLNALKAFKSGEVRVLVATDIAARGIDVDGISHVVNFDFPMHPEDYVHRIGRTGRAQAIGDAISFVTPEDRDALRSLERFIGRGVVRKRADDFDYHAVPASSPERRENRPLTERKSPILETVARKRRPEIPAGIGGTMADVSGGDNNALVELSNFQHHFSAPGKRKTTSFLVHMAHGTGKTFSLQHGSPCVP